MKSHDKANDHFSHICNRPEKKDMLVRTYIVNSRWRTVSNNGTRTPERDKEDVQGKANIKEEKSR
jgi:hypothetical protein